MNKKQKSFRAPIDESYASCESMHVELLIYVINKKADYVSKVLRIEPSHSQMKGEKIFNSHGIEREAKTTYWCLSSEGKVVSKDIRDHLN